MITTKSFLKKFIIFGSLLKVHTPILESNQNQGIVPKVDLFRSIFVHSL